MRQNPDVIWDRDYMKQAPTDEISEAQKKASGDPKPFDIFAGMQGEPAPPSKASSASGNLPFDVFAGMSGQPIATNAKINNDPAPANLSFTEKHPRFFVYLAIALLALLAGVYLGSKLAG